MLGSIPDRELIAHLEQLRCTEREASVEFLHHLNEIERRSLHLRLGYPSLFAYCTGHLLYSESDAARRVQAARCLQRYPAVGPLLHSGEINLNTLGLVANLLTDATVDQWLARICGKNQREVEAIAATVRPPVTLRDRARVVHVAVPAAHPLPLAPASRSTAEPSATSPPELAPSVPTPPTAPEETAGPAISPTDARTGGEQPRTPPLTRPKVYIQFLADQSFMAKYRAATELLSNRLGRLTFEAVFVALIEDFIRRHEPAARHRRREDAAARAAQARDRAPIARRTRDAVFARDGGRCTFVGSDGMRCDASLHLHVDHIKPVARGGSNDISNLRLLCARHNRLQAERILGRDVMNGFRRREGPRD